MLLNEFDELSKELLNQTTDKLENKYNKTALKIIRNDFKDTIKEYSADESALEEMIYSDLCGALAYYNELYDIEEQIECGKLMERA